MESIRWERWSSIHKNRLEKRAEQGALRVEIGDVPYRKRCEDLHRRVISLPETGVNVWGSLTSVDGFCMSYFLLGRQQEALEMMSKVLDMIDINIETETKDPEDKWHLADFALHPLLKVWTLFGPNAAEPVEAGHPIWKRFENMISRFIWHEGDLSPNHNLLHMAGRYMAAIHCPDHVAFKGMTAPELEVYAKHEVQAWIVDWWTKGSAEWGASLYDNVLLLALINILDHGRDEELIAQAESVIDKICLEHALDHFQGVFAGAARRTYSAYRLNGMLSPSRPLHYLWFSEGQDELSMEGWHFIGGALMAATSSYRPLNMVRDLAHESSVTEHSMMHKAGFWNSWVGSRVDRPKDVPVDRFIKNTYRLPKAMLSTMCCPGGGSRVTEQVTQVTLSPQAVFCANHPVLEPYANDPLNGAVDQIIKGYEEGEPISDEPTAMWVPGTMPPGMSGDIRPGYWQGNQFGPRSYGQKNFSMLIYSLDEDVMFPFVHVYWPKGAIDEQRMNICPRAGSREGRWHFGRLGEAYVGLWSSAPLEVMERGQWAGRELKCHALEVALVFRIGDDSRHESFEAFIAESMDMPIVFEPEQGYLDGIRMGEERWFMDYRQGAFKNAESVPLQEDHLRCSLGRMVLGERELKLEKNGEVARLKV